MHLKHGLHLAYCTNIHRGESWPETFAALQNYTLAVRDEVSRGQAYAIGLRLSDLASRQLSAPDERARFREWLERENCYVFTINGFPFGQFHGTRVKEQVYAPDWTSRERLEYTQRLFELLAEFLPAGLEGSVSTVPCSYKEFIRSEEQVAAMRRNLWECVEYIAALSERTGKLLHLGLEPEPLCYVETSEETVAFIEQMQAERPGDPRLARHLGVNYDCCHLAVEFEEPQAGLRLFRERGIRVSKIHLSSALKVAPSGEVRQALTAFADDTYFHQVVEKGPEEELRRYKDLNIALKAWTCGSDQLEWRIHFHVPLHSQPTELFSTTTDHLLGVLDLLQEDPGLCRHLEMETYTWEVMPPAMKNRSVVAQLVGEYGWCLEQLRRRGLA